MDESAYIVNHGNLFNNFYLQTFY